MLNHNFCCFGKSGAASSCVARLHAPSDGSVGAVAVTELVNGAPVAVMAQFQKLRASVAVLIRHWSVAECAPASGGLTNTAVDILMSFVDVIWQPILVEPGVIAVCGELTCVVQSIWRSR